MSDIDTLYDHLIEQQFIPSPKIMLDSYIKQFYYSKTELNEITKNMLNEVKKVKSSNTLTKEQYLIDSYVFSLLYEHNNLYGFAY